MEEVYIVNAYRSAVSKAKKGKLRFTRPDDLGAEIISQITRKIPGFDNNFINDVIVGNATPEAEQGLNIGRMISLLGLETLQSNHNHC